MKSIFVKNWHTITKIDDEPSDCRIGVKIRENGLLETRWISIECSCDIAVLESHYLAVGGSPLVYGEAASAVDRALELAFTRVNEGEEIAIKVELEAKYVDFPSQEASYSKKHVDLPCQEVSSFDKHLDLPKKKVDSSKESYENSAPEKLESDLPENLIILDPPTILVSCIGSYEIVSNGKEPYEYSPEELLSLAKSLKDKSNAAGLEISAIYLLEKSIKWSSLIDSQELTHESRNSLFVLQIQCYNNLAFWYLSLKRFEDTVRVASYVLGEESINIKALYRRGVANAALQNYETARDDLEKITSVEPHNRAATHQLGLISEKQKTIDKKYAIAMNKFIYGS